MKTIITYSFVSYAQKLNAKAEVSFLSLVALCFFAPTLLAVRKHRENLVWIFFINALLGLTIVGWFASLSMAYINVTKKDKNNLKNALTTKV